MPYKGTGPAVTALLSGEVGLYFTTVPAAVPLVKGGQGARARRDEHDALTADA